MAKVSGPMMSMDARGKFGNALVFTAWKGRQVVRKFVVPANPRAQGQEDARNRTRVAGAAQKFANACLLMGDGRTATDLTLLKSAAPSGFSWNGNLVKAMVGAGGLDYTMAQASYAALQVGEKAAWDAAAAALTPAIGQVVQTMAGGVPTTPMTAGEVFYLYQSGLASLGIATTPTATPPTYA